MVVFRCCADSCSTYRKKCPLDGTIEEDIFLMLLDSTLMRIASCIIDGRALRAKSMAESMKKKSTRGVALPSACHMQTCHAIPTLPAKDFRDWCTIHSKIVYLN